MTIGDISNNLKPKTLFDMTQQRPALVTIPLCFITIAMTYYDNKRIRCSRKTGDHGTLMRQETSGQNRVFAANFLE